MAFSLSVDSEQLRLYCANAENGSLRLRKLCFTDYVKCQGICTQRLHGYRREFIIEFKQRKAPLIPSQRVERIVNVYTSSNSKLNGQIAGLQRNKTHSAHIPRSVYKQGLTFFKRGGGGNIVGFSHSKGQSHKNKSFQKSRYGTICFMSVT